jgi:DNA-binding Xre family transcriptional regulator
MDTMLSYSESLKVRMNAVGIASFQALAQHSGVSRRQIDGLRRGEVQALPVKNVLRIAAALQLSLADLLNQFGSPIPIASNPEAAEVLTMAPHPSGTAGFPDYQQSQSELERMKSLHLETFQAEVLNILESLILQWPTAAHLARQNPTFAAVKLIPLLKPIEQLLQAWDIEAIATVGEIVGYNPTLHLWAGDSAPPERHRPVQVSHVGYRQRERLLYRAKVRAPKPETVSST